MSWEPRDLGLLGERPAARPTLGDVGLFYAGKRHLFSGPPESAKTIAAYATALAVIRAGGVVVLIDTEMGEYEARDRFRELGATDADLARLHYIAPEEEATEGIVRGLLDLEPDLVVFDAALGVFNLQGLDDNKRGDIETFGALFLRPLSDNEVASILIDHVTKNPEARQGFAIGSERKKGIVDVHLGFEPVQALTRGGHGLYRILTHKDRLGWLPRPKAGELHIESGELGELSWRFNIAGDQQKPDDGFRPTALMERISRYLEPRDEPVSRNTVLAAISGKTDYKRLAINCLVREGYAEEADGPRKARQLLSTQAFRADDCAPTVPLRGEDRPRPDCAPQKPLNEADPRPRPDCALTAPHARESTAPPTALSPTGERVGRGEVGEKRKAASFVTDSLPDQPSENAGTDPDDAQRELDRLRRKRDLHERRDHYQRLVDQGHLTGLDADELARLDARFGWVT